MVVVLAASSTTVVPSAEAVPATITFRGQVVGPGYADMYPTDVVANATHYFVNDNGRYRILAVNRVTGLIDYQATKSRVKGSDEFGAGRGLGMDSAGNLYAADTLNNRVQKLSPLLVPILSFGRRGSGLGEFRGVSDVAIGPGRDASGSMTELAYVTDKYAKGDNNSRVEAFTLDGQFVRLIGENRLLHYGQLAVSPISGRIFISEGRRQGFVIFENDGTFVKAVGGRGTGPGQFTGMPRGITVATNGDVFVTDSDGRRIEVFDDDGAFKFMFGSEGTGSGQFTGPKGLVVTSDHKVLVCDLYGYGLEEFTEDGTWLRSMFGTPPPVNGVNKPRGLDINATGKINVIDWWHQSIVRVRADGSNAERIGSTGDRGKTGALTFPTDVAVQPGTGLLYIANRESNNIEILNVKGTAHGPPGFGADLLYHPEALAFAPDGSLIVSDTPNDRLVRFTIDPTTGAGTFSELLGSPGPVSSGPGFLRHPGGVAVAPDGTVWVADTNNNSIQKLSPAGAWTRFTAPSGSTDFNSPWGVTIGPDNNVYVTDSANARVVKMTQNGDVLALAEGALGGKPLYWPEGIRVRSNLNIVVSDTLNDRVIELKNS